MKHPHLLPALLAVSLFAAVLTGGHLHARHEELRYVRVLAPDFFDQKNRGSALQKAALRKPDLLPFYGSSELVIHANQFHASELFRSYPTGFTIFPVGSLGTTSLIIAQDLAAVGSMLRGRKIAISISPTSFMSEEVEPRHYEGNFSSPHANALAFSTDLSFGLKQDIARRMLEYPASLRNDPLLRFTLKQLAEGSGKSRILYYAVLPLGKLRNVVSELQDDWETLSYIRSHPVPTPHISRQRSILDWQELLALAGQEHEQHATNNPFGLDNDQWLDFRRHKTNWRFVRTGARFLEDPPRCKEWADLDLLLRELDELQARPLILSMPFPGPLYDYVGIPRTKRQNYYDRLHQAVASHGVPFADFAEHDETKDFLFDAWAHLSEKGWVYYARALNDFFHSEVPDPPASFGGTDSGKAEPASGVAQAKERGKREEKGGA